MNFEKAKNTYRKNAVVQKQMAGVLISDLVKYSKNEFKKIFEIGSGTGFLTDEIRKNLKYEKIILNDITDNFTNFEPDEYIKGDILSIELKEKFDLIISNAVFQWIEDYDLLFKKMNNALIYDGVLAFSTFGKNNFSQIKDITGLGLSYPDLKDYIIKNDFKIIYYEEELKTLYFKSLKELLSHIKFTGVKTDNKVWTKTDYKNFEKRYIENYKDDLGYELTYHPIFYILKKGA